MSNINYELGDINDIRNVAIAMEKEKEVPVLESSEESTLDVVSGFFSFIGSILNKTYEVVRDVVISVVELIGVTSKGVLSAGVAFLAMLGIDMESVAVSDPSGVVGYLVAIDTTSVVLIATFVIASVYAYTELTRPSTE